MSKLNQLVESVDHEVEVMGALALRVGVFIATIRGHGQEGIEIGEH